MAFICLPPKLEFCKVLFGGFNAPVFGMCVHRILVLEVLISQYPAMKY